jgi:HK97 family phage major capsid protein
MARVNLDGTGWLKEQYDSTVVQRYVKSSAVESEFRTVNMTSNTLRIPRIDDMDVNFIPKGAAYGEDTSGADTILLEASKIGGAIRIAEEDVQDDKLADFLTLKKNSAASAFAQKIDNAGLGTTTASGGDGSTVPYTSLYRTLATADATTGYGAGDNLVSGAELNYDTVNELLALVEQSDYFNDSSIVAIASPKFRTLIRGLKDNTGRPLFLADVINGSSVDTILGRRVVYTTGAHTSTVAETVTSGAGGAAGASGNPLFAFVNTDHAIVGKRSGLESIVDNGTAAFLTDEAIMKVRARRAVGYTIPGAHALFELTK